MGAALLDPNLQTGETRGARATQIERFQQASLVQRNRQTSNHMIVLLEYLSLTGFRPGSQPFSARVGAA